MSSFPEGTGGGGGGGDGAGWGGWAEEGSVENFRQYYTRSCHALECLGGGRGGGRLLLFEIQAISCTNKQ